MERTQSQVVYTPLLQGNKLLHHINYLSSIKNTVNGGSLYHSSKISGKWLIAYALRIFVMRG
jgi:hypothetical protein